MTIIIVVEHFDDIVHSFQQQLGVFVSIDDLQHVLPAVGVVVNEIDKSRGFVVGRGSASAHRQTVSVHAHDGVENVEMF